MSDDDTSDNAMAIELREGRWWLNAPTDAKRRNYGPYALRDTAEAVLGVLRRQTEAAKAAESRQP
jgi:hypothetical protein